jgi:hypothetical protein
MRYDYAEIRRFLEHFKWNSSIADKKIYEDILWREKTMNEL